jgi:glycine/serine hydroxymethyltransferase
MMIPCPNIDLSHFDARKLEMLRHLPHHVSHFVSEIDAEEVSRVAREVTYTVVGFGVLAFQRAQVQRRAVVDAFQETGPTYLASVAHQAAVTLEELRTLVDTVRNPGQSSSSH